MFLITERTKTVSVVMSDCVVTRFGNDEQFLTLFDRSAAGGQREQCPYRNSLQKVFPPSGVINGVSFVNFVKPLGQSDSNLTVLTVLSKTLRFAALWILDMILLC